MEAALNRIEAARVSRGQEFYSLSMDVSDHTDVSTKIKRAVGEFGIPDILIHCAGIADAGYFEDTSYEALTMSFGQIYMERETLQPPCCHT